MCKALSLDLACSKSGTGKASDCTGPLTALEGMAQRQGWHGQRTCRRIPLVPAAARASVVLLHPAPVHWTIAKGDHCLINWCRSRVQR